MDDGVMKEARTMTRYKEKGGRGGKLFRREITMHMRRATRKIECAIVMT